MLFLKILNKKNDLGNQMFQYAALHSKAMDLNCKLHLNNNILSKYFNINYDKLGNKKNIKYKFIEGENNFNRIRKNTELVGFFESENYFKKNKYKIKEIFSIKDKDILSKCQNNIYNIKNKFPNHTLIGLYISNKYMDDIKKDTWLYNYLFRSFLFFSDIPNKKFLIFTDKINDEWSKKNFKGSQYIFVENINDINNFVLMTLCDHLILSSDSNFGWWAGYLNLNPNKRIICPMLPNIKKDWSNFWSNEFIVI